MIEPRSDDDRVRARHRWQQSNVLRTLLNKGMEPAEILRQFPTDWTVSEIEDLRHSLIDEKDGV